MITVLWEDQRDVQLNTFTPHELLVRAVADDLALDHWQVEPKIRWKAMKGNGKVLRELRTNGPSLRGVVYAVLDSDQVWRLTDQPKNICVPLAARACTSMVQTPGVDTRIRLLEKNVESLLEAIQRVKPHLTLPTKNPNSRDMFVRQSGVLNAQAREDRHKVRAECPSFHKLAVRVAEVVGPLLKVSK